MSGSRLTVELIGCGAFFVDSQSDREYIQNALQHERPVYLLENEQNSCMIQLPQLHDAKCYWDAYSRAVELANRRRDILRERYPESGFRSFVSNELVTYIMAEVDHPVPVVRTWRIPPGPDVLWEVYSMAADKSELVLDKEKLVTRSIWEFIPRRR